MLGQNRSDTPALFLVFLYLCGKGEDFMKLTEKQKRFCDEYLIDCNATQAAIRAGYSKKTAYAIGEENLKKPELKSYIEQQLELISSKQIASAEEVMKYLTSVLRGETKSEVVVVEGIGEGCSEARTMEKAPDERERLKAAELLGKRYGIYTDKLNMTGAIPVVISDDLGEEDEGQ